MKPGIIQHACSAVVFAVFASGAATTPPTIAAEPTITEAEPALSERSANVDLIKAVYDRFIFATASAGDVAPETYFTENALKKLQEDYDFDCEEEPCYAYYALRTAMQDSNPESDGSSKIYRIDPDEDGWFTVFYSDMGWPGTTRIRIMDGKIDDYRRSDQ